MNPLILVTNKFEADPIPFGVGRICCIRANYCQAVVSGGGVPVLSAMGDPEVYTATFQGLLLTGSSSDVTPALYGQENTAAAGCDSELDRMELDLVNAFLRAGKPILGICRGIQVLNVALGGTLYQDIPTQRPDAIVHSGPTDRDDVFHQLETLPGSAMEKLYGTGLLTNSYHHQAVSTLGRGLRATAWTEDGIVEAVEHETLPLLAVQFHPERMIGKEQTHAADMRPLMQYFVDLCRQ